MIGFQPECSDFLQHQGLLLSGHSLAASRRIKCDLKKLPACPSELFAEVRMDKDDYSSFERDELVNRSAVIAND